MLDVTNRITALDSFDEAAWPLDEPRPVGWIMQRGFPLLRNTEAWRCDLALSRSDVLMLYREHLVDDVHER